MKSKLVCLITCLLGIANISSESVNKSNSFKLTNYNGMRIERNSEKNSISHQDIWAEINDSVVFNCSLRVTKDQHIVWHRKYDKLGVHVLTIESETFISDLRIRPIKEIFPVDKSKDSVVFENSENEKLTWNLEIRKLKLEDSALYYCVLNSENSYGQIYKLNVLPHLTSLNGSEVAIDDSDYSVNVPTRIHLICQFNDLIDGTRNQIRWYFHHYKLNNNLKNFQIVETRDVIRNITTSTLYIANTKGREHLGKYRCHFKGLHKVIKVHSVKDKPNSISSSNRLIHDVKESNQASCIYSTKQVSLIFNLNIFMLLIKVF